MGQCMCVSLLLVASTALCLDNRPTNAKTPLSARLKTENASVQNKGNEFGCACVLTLYIASVALKPVDQCKYVSLVL